MHAVIEMPTYLADAADLTEEQRADIFTEVAKNPKMGVPMPGTGGARKARIAGRGQGKRGGYRLIIFYAAKDVPVLLLRLLSKGERADLSKTEKNELRKWLGGVAENYRASVRAKVATMKWRHA